MLTCPRCGLLFAPWEKRYLLTHSPNADILRGFRPNHVEYSLHRETVIQAPKHQWEVICSTCYSGSA